MEVVALVACVLLGLGFVGYLRVQHVARAVRAADQALDPTARLVGRIALGVGLAPTVLLIARGLEPPASLVVGMLTSAGVFAVALGWLGLEGQLLETASETALRRAARQPPPTSRRGRRVAIALGLLLLALSITGCVLICATHG